LRGYNLLPTGQLILIKLRKAIYCPTENPTKLLGHLTETLTYYTKFDPSSRAECPFSTPTLFLNPRLIFEKNLNPPRRSCEYSI
jgi:hypothetical protein